MTITNRTDQHASFDTLKVLIVDDDQAMRNLLRTAIMQWGHQVIEAVDGVNAWEIMQQPDAPGLLILDWQMPALDGRGLCKLIRQQLNNQPYIIFLTQVHGAADIVRGFEAGADEFLLKPVNFPELRNHLFAGEKIIKYLKIIEEQKSLLQAYAKYAETIEQLHFTISDCLMEKFKV